jgi:CBS domain containing-hemolysin-like protein
LGLGWIGEPAFAALIEAPPALGVGAEVQHGVALVLAFGVITVLHIVLGELAPKSMAIQRAERMTLWVAAPMRAFHFFFYPVLWLLNRASALVLRPFGLQPGAEDESALGADELRLVLAISQRRGLFSERSLQIIERSFSLGKRTARELMTPRGDVLTLATTQSVSQSLALVGESGFSRFPLCRDADLAHVVGGVHARDLLAGALDLRKKLVDIARGRSSCRGG